MKSRILALSAALAIFGMVMTPSTLSYLVDQNTTINTFSAGTVQIATTAVKDNCSEIGYEATCTETITVKNTGSVSAYVRIEVWIPADALSKDDSGSPKFYSLSIDAPSDYSLSEETEETKNEVTFRKYTYTKEAPLSVATEAPPVVLELTNHQIAHAVSDNLNGEDCEGVTCSVSTTASVVDAGVEIYTQAIQAQGFSSAAEAFDHY